MTQKKITKPMRDTEGNILYGDEKYWNGIETGIVQPGPSQLEQMKLSTPGNTMTHTFNVKLEDNWDKTIDFRVDGKTVGTLFLDGPIRFQGDTDQSATVFFDQLIKRTVYQDLNALDLNQLKELRENVNQRIYDKERGN